MIRKRQEVKEEGGVLNIVGKLLVNVVALLIVEYLVPGFVLGNIGVAIVAAIVIGVINTFIRPVIQILALPFSIVTLGITAFLINVALLMLAARIVPGFEIDGFLTAAVSSIALTLIGSFLHKLAK
jgi:putative membrane protein